MISFATGDVTEDGDGTTLGGVAGGVVSEVGVSAGVATGAEALASGEEFWRAVMAVQLVETKSSPTITIAGTGPAHTLS
jgi:hypothetical protein